MLTIVKLITTSLALIDVQAASLDGSSTKGTLQQLTSEDVVVATNDGQTVKLPLANVLELKFVTGKGDQVAPPSTLEAVFRDGSTIPLQQVEATAETVTATADQLSDLEIPRPEIRALRLQELKREWEPQWNAFLERSNEQELLIIAKRDGSGLDFLAGVVSKVGEKEVPILLSGDEIPVPRARVLGVVFAAAKGPERPAGTTALKLLGGSSLNASAVSMKAGQIEFQTSWGQQLSIPADRLSAIDYSGGRLHYLSDLEPLSERYFGLDPPGREWSTLFSEDVGTRTGLLSQWRYSRDRFPNNGRPPLTLRGKVYSKGLCIFPSAAIEYALDGHYTRLSAIVGVDDDVAFNQQKDGPPTAVELRIEADGDDVFRKIISAPAKPFHLDLDLSGVTTMAIFVDFGDGESTCDYLDLADAKLIVDTSKN